MAAIRQQLGPSERWSFYDQHDYIVIGTSASRQLLACSRNYRLIRDQYRSSSPPPRNGALPLPNGPLLSGPYHLCRFDVGALFDELYGTSCGTRKINWAAALGRGPAYYVRKWCGPKSTFSVPALPSTPSVATNSLPFGGLISGFPPVLAVSWPPNTWIWPPPVPWKIELYCRRACLIRLSVRLFTLIVANYLYVIAAHYF